MQTIHVVKPFTLQIDPVKRKTQDPMDASKEIEETLPPVYQFYEVGIYEVEDHIAAHWYVRPNLRGYQEPAKGPAAAEYQAAQMMQPKPEGAALAPAYPTQPMPPDAQGPRQTPLPPMVTRMEPITP